MLAASAAGAAGLALSACGRSEPSPNLGQAIAATEQARPHTGRTVTATLTAQPASIDLGGPVARTLAYGDALPGTLIRANVGDELAVTVKNRLNSPTSVHWHGIALRNDMDGAFPPLQTSPRTATSLTGFRRLIQAHSEVIHTSACRQTTGCICR